VSQGRVAPSATRPNPVERIIEAQWVAAEHGASRQFPAEQPRYSIFYGPASRHARPTIITSGSSAWPFARFLDSCWLVNELALAVKIQYGRAAIGGRTGQFALPPPR